MILWLLFLSILSIIKADPAGCCAYTSYYWSCPTDETCSCSNFKDACYFTTGDGSCYIYATCACCISGNSQQYNNFCKDCSCTSAAGLNYTTNMDGYCYVYQPPEEIGCCNNDNSFQFNNPFVNYTCKAAEGLCKIDTDYGCWIMGPCSYEGCCLMLDPYTNSPTSSCDSFPGSTNFTVKNSAGDVCWIYSPSIDMVGGCGCSNVTGNCTCESSSLACNITFFDSTWGIIPPGSSALYAWYPQDWSYPVTESYYCPLNYDPPAILITILCLVVSGLLTLCYLVKRYDPEFFQTTNIFKKIYRLGTILNMFWPGVHMSITLGYLYWLLDSQTFTPVQVPSPDESDQQTPYYILVNADWYAPNNATVIIPPNATTINGQDCYVSTATTPTFFPGYPGIFVFLVISLIHTFYTMFNPDNKKTNYFIYCLATAVNLFTVPWTWYAWDYCYSLLPSYTGSLGHIYTTLYSIDCACIGIIVFVWVLILCFGVGINGFCVTILVIVVMALVGFVYKIMTYLQLALRFYPKLSVILDLTFHIHFVASMCIPAFKGKIGGYNRMTK